MTTAKPRSRLWLRIAVPFLCFIIAGSLILIVFLETFYRRQAGEIFRSTARSNTEFIRSTRIPITPRYAYKLGQVLGLRVFFRATTGRRLTTPNVATSRADLARLVTVVPADGSILRDAGKFEAVALPIDPQHDVVFVRSSPAASHIFLGQRTSWIVLATFWALSFVLAWSISRTVVRPLQALARRLPDIARSDRLGALPGAERSDEIGQLARSFEQTHADLLDERHRREQAEKLALIGKMATGMTHELHNPVAAIRLHAQLIESSSPETLATSAAASLPLILAETVTIESLVNQWLFLARPEPPKTSPVDLRSLIDDEIRSLAPLAAHAGVDVVNEVPEDLVAQADGRRLRQVARNIMVNSVQAMFKGGTLTISGGDAAPNVELTFRDNGPGFSPEALLRHSELFFSEKEGGMGIGLSVTGEIVRAHGGTIVFDNHPEGGAVVRLELPREARDGT